MAEKQPQKEAKIYNQVHQNSILEELVTKEKRYLKLNKVCNPNPTKRYFDGAEKPNSFARNDPADDFFFEKAKVAFGTPQERYGDAPVTVNQEYGWVHTRLETNAPDYEYALYKPRNATEMTRRGYIKR